MTRTDDARPEMIERICALHPCHGREQIERWAQHWPADVTPLWLAENPQRGGDTVCTEDRLWLLIHLEPEAAVHCAEKWALRAVRDHATSAIRSAIVKLDAVGVRHELGRHVFACASADDLGAAWDAARAAGGAAWDAEAESQLADLIANVKRGMR